MGFGLAAKQYILMAGPVGLNKEFAGCFHGSMRFIDGAFATTLWDVKMISNTF
jgi:hypothetical protein